MKKILLTSICFLCIGGVVMAQGAQKKKSPKQLATRMATTTTHDKKQIALKQEAAKQAQSPVTDRIQKAEAVAPKVSNKK